LAVMLGSGGSGRTKCLSRDGRIDASGDFVVFARRGLFAGVSLQGSTLRPDNDANKNLYGKKLDAKEIVLEGAVPAPPSATKLLSTLDKASPKNKSKS